MLEMLINQYADQFGADFPLADFADCAEIDLLNVIYYCVQNNVPYEKGMDVPDILNGAPTSK